MGERRRIVVQRHPILRPEAHDVLLRAHPRLEVVLATSNDECDRAAARAVAAVVFSWRPADLLARAPRLRWLQLMSAGVDDVPRAVLDAPLTITATKGPLALPMAEHAVVLLMALARRVPRFQERQRTRRWQRDPAALLELAQLTGKTVLVVGTGGVGGLVARICKRGFAMRVWGMSRTSRDHPDVDQYVARANLHGALAEADFVVLAAPHTPETHHLIDATALAAMRPEGILVNVARGQLVDEAALAAALQSGTIAGAGLASFAVQKG